MTSFTDLIDRASERPGGTAMAASDEFFAPRENLLLQPDALHRFESEVAAAGEATHARLHIFPDGAVSRLRLWSWPAPTGSVRR